MKVTPKKPSFVELTKRGDAILAASDDVFSKLRMNLALNVKIREKIAFNNRDVKVSPTKLA